MQSQPAESQFSLDLLDDSEYVDGHTQGSPRADPIADGLWKSNSNFCYKANTTKTRRRQLVHSMSTDHPLYNYLRSKYGLDKKKRKRHNNDVE